MLPAAAATAGLPQVMAGVVIAMIVLLPGTGAELRAAHGDGMQSSINLVLGFVLATDM